MYIVSWTLFLIGIVLTQKAIYASERFAPLRIGKDGFQKLKKVYKKTINYRRKEYSFNAISVLLFGTEFWTISSQK